MDTTTFERQLFLAGRRPELAQLDPYNPHLPRQPGTTLSLTNLLRTVGIEPERTCKLHNAGNDAFMALTALQLLLEPTTKIGELRPPPPRPRSSSSSTGVLGMRRRSIAGMPLSLSPLGAGSRPASVAPASAWFGIPNVNANANATAKGTSSRPGSSSKDTNEWGARQSAYGYATVAARNGAGTGTGAGSGSGVGAGAGMGVGTASTLGPSGHRRRGRAAGHSYSQPRKDVQSAMEQLQL